MQCSCLLKVVKDCVYFYYMHINLYFSSEYMRHIIMPWCVKRWTMTWNMSLDLFSKSFSFMSDSNLELFTLTELPDHSLLCDMILGHVWIWCDMMLGYVRKSCDMILGYVRISCDMMLRLCKDMMWYDTRLWKDIMWYDTRLWKDMICDMIDAWCCVCIQEIGAQWYKWRADQLSLSDDEIISACEGILVQKSATLTCLVWYVHWFTTVFNLQCMQQCESCGIIYFLKVFTLTCDIPELNTNSFLSKIYRSATQKSTVKTVLRDISK